MTRFPFAALGALFLASCAGTPPPAIEVQVQRVEVPVAVPCVRRADIPDAPAKVGTRLNGQAGHDLQIVDASALELRSWGEMLHAVLVGCSTASTGPAR